MVFQVDQYNWGGDYRPKTWGRLAFFPEKGFFIQMICEEKDPVGICREKNGRVCAETAMEAFFQFYPQEDEKQYYLNLEANSLGTLHVKYGRGRSEREALPEELHEACSCVCEKMKDGWKMEVWVPLSVIRYVYGKADLQSGDTFKCNFYKISEEQKPVHFGSYTKIKSKSPDFHRPEDFAWAVIEP